MKKAEKLYLNTNGQLTVLDPIMSQFICICIMKGQYSEYNTTLLIEKKYMREFQKFLNRQEILIRIGNKDVKLKGVSKLSLELGKVKARLLS